MNSIRPARRQHRPKKRKSPSAIPGIRGDTTNAHSIQREKERVKMSELVKATAGSMTDGGLFNFNGNDIHVINQDGEPWFVASEVCGILDLSNITEALRGLDDDERGKIRNPDVTSKGGNPNITVINESGLYSLVITSRKPEAKTFKKWVTSEVLPAIRKTGAYSTANYYIPQTLPEALRLAANLAEENSKLKPKADIADRIANSEGCLNIRDTAKALKMPEKKLVHWLLMNSWMYRDQKGRLRGYSHKTPRYLIHKITSIPTDEDAERVAVQVLVTTEGLIRLAEIFNVDTSSTCNAA